MTSRCFAAVFSMICACSAGCAKPTGRLLRYTTGVAGGAAKKPVTLAPSALASATPCAAAFSDSEEPSVGTRMFLNMIASPHFA